jgi:hypothetical protein
MADVSDLKSEARYERVGSSPTSGTSQFQPAASPRRMARITVSIVLIRA